MMVAAHTHRGSTGNSTNRLAAIKGPLSGAVLGAIGGLGCGVDPPPYSSTTAGTTYCADFLHFAHECATWATAAFLVCLCLAVAAGFLAAQLNNDQAKEGSFLRKNQSTFLFALAVLAGILGAYFHSRADAASSAAAEVEVAMTNGDDGRRYNLCLGAASHWDGSLSKALDAANAAAPKADANGASQLAEAVGRGGEARAQIIGATEKHGQVLATLLDAVEKAIPPAKMSDDLAAKLNTARAALKDGDNTLGEATRLSNATTELVAKAKESLKPVDDGQKPAAGPPAAAPKAGEQRDANPR